MDPMREHFDEVTFPETIRLLFFSMKIDGFGKACWQVPCLDFWGGILIICLGLLMVASIFKIRRDRGGFLLEGNKVSACFFLLVGKLFWSETFPKHGDSFCLV